MQYKRYMFLFVLMVYIDSLNARTLRVDDFIAIAMKKSPDIKIAYYEMTGAKQGSIIAKSSRLPQITLDIDTSRLNDRYKGGRLNQTDTLSGNIALSQLIYDFGRSSAEMKVAIQTQKAYAEQFKQTVADKILEVKSRYYDALKAKTLIRVYEKNLELQKAHLYSAKKYLKAGIKTIVDVTDAKMRVEKAKKSLNDAKYMLQFRRTLLEESIGDIPYGGKYRLYTPVKDFKSWRLPNERHNLKYLFEYALKHRAVLKAIRHNILSSQALAQRKEADRYPYIDLAAEVGAKNIDAKDSYQLPNHHERVAIRANWDIFTGYRQSAEIQKARIDAMKSHSQADRAKLAVRREVTQNYLNLKNRRDDFNLNRSIVQQAKKKYIQAKKRYANDLADYIELQDAHQSYIESLASLVNSYYEYFTAKAQLEHSVGE